MPIIKSASKRMRQESVRRDRNKAFKRGLRADIKSLEKAIESGDKDKIAEGLKAAQSSLHKAVKKNLLHKNAASRKMSRLSKKVQPTDLVASKTVTKKVTKSTVKTPVKKTSKPVAKKVAKK